MIKGFVFSSYKHSEQSVSCLLTLNWSEHFIWRVYLQMWSANNNISLLSHTCEVIPTRVWLHHMLNSRVEYFHIFLIQSILLIFLSSLHNTLLHLNWKPTTLKQLWHNTKSTICAIWQNYLKTFEKLFIMIQTCCSIYVRCSIYNHFLKPLQQNIHILWHQTLTVMKIRRFLLILEHFFEYYSKIEYSPGISIS